MKKGYSGTAGMQMPKKTKASGHMKSVSNYGDMSKNMGGVSLKPTKLKNVSTLKGTSNGSYRTGYKKGMGTGKK